MATQTELHQQMATMQTEIREFLAPIAMEANKPLDPGLVSAIMFERITAEEDEFVSNDGSRHWLVHLYTLSPGLVVGPSGATVDELRGRLVAATGDCQLRLNLIDFGRIHANRHLLSA